MPRVIEVTHANSIDGRCHGCGDLNPKVAIQIGWKTPFPNFLVQIRMCDTCAETMNRSWRDFRAGRS